MLSIRLLVPLVLLLGCEAQPPGASPAPVVAAPAEQASDLPGPSELPPPASATATGGAQAAPAGTVYDPSAEAAERYRAWLDYELDAETDRLRDFESDAYPTGVVVCSQFALRARASEIEAGLKVKQWSGSGAAGIVKSALEALCPQFNSGYRTHFDRNVDSASVVLASAMSWPQGPPLFYELGYFMKAACGYLRVTGSVDGFEAYLQSFRPGGSNQAGRAAAFLRRVPDNLLLRRAANHTVLAGCPGSHRLLGPYWTTA